jgi:flagellar protein FlaG
VNSLIYRKGRNIVPSNINFSGSAGIASRPIPTPLPSNGIGNTHGLDAGIKPASKIDLPHNTKTSVDPAQARSNVKEAVSFLNEQLSANNRGIGFTVSEGDNTPIVTVRNTKTGEVVRQIPNDVVIKIAQNIDASKGSIEDKKA